MRFSKKKKVVYLANPKTGSTSIRSILNPISDHQELIDNQQFHEHWTASQYRSVFTKNGWRWDDYYKFLTIRNPWKKYVSNYLFSKPDHRFRPFYDPAYEASDTRPHDFPAWVKHYVRDLDRFPPGCPPLRNFAFEADECLVDDIYCIETFSTDALPKLIERLALPHNLELPRLNRSGTNTDYRNFFDDESIELVAGVCQDDIAIGEYTF